MVFVPTLKMPKYFADPFFFNIMLMYLQEQPRNPTAKHSEKGHANAGFGPRNVFSTEVLCRDRIADFFLHSWMSNLISTSEIIESRISDLKRWSN